MTVGRTSSSCNHWHQYHTRQYITAISDRIMMVAYTVTTLSVFFNTVVISIGFWLVIPPMRKMMRKRHRMKKYRMTMILMSLASFTIAVFIPLEVISQLIKITRGVACYWYIVMNFMRLLIDTTTSMCYLTIAVERLYIMVKNRARTIPSRMCTYVLIALCLCHIPAFLKTAIDHKNCIMYVSQNGTNDTANGMDYSVCSLYYLSWCLSVEELVVFLLTTIVYVLLILTVYHNMRRLQPMWSLEQVQHKNAICAISGWAPNERCLAERCATLVTEQKRSRRKTLPSNDGLDWSITTRTRGRKTSLDVLSCSHLEGMTISLKYTANGHDTSSVHSVASTVSSSAADQVRKDSSSKTAHSICSASNETARDNVQNHPANTGFSNTDQLAAAQNSDVKAHPFNLHSTVLPHKVVKEPYLQVGANLLKRVTFILALMLVFTLSKAVFIIAMPYIKLDVVDFYHPFINVIHWSTFLAVPRAFIHMNSVLARLL